VIVGNEESVRGMMKEPEDQKAASEDLAKTWE
jgi:hypothetical protein